jgi:hypothetical protein
MTTETTAELDQFRDFLNKRQDGGASFNSLDEAVDDFRRYQRELAALKCKLQSAEEQADQGQVGPFDAQTTMRHVQEKLARQDSAE